MFIYEKKSLGVGKCIYFALMVDALFCHKQPIITPFSEIETLVAAASKTLV
jgi:hypothetical protein